MNKSIRETGVALRELGGPDTSSKELDEYGVQLSGIDNRLSEIIMREVNWLSVHKMIDYSTLCLFLRIVQHGVPVGIYENLIKTRDTRTTKGLYKIPRFSLNISLETFMNQAIRLHNKLPESIRQLDQGIIQKNELWKWVISNIAVKP